MSWQQDGENQPKENVARPLKVGDVYPATALRLNDDGEGVVLLDGLVTFVPGLLPGELADVQVISVTRRFARATLASSVRANVDAGPQEGTVRAVPECSVFGLCGGCQLQHMDYGAQLTHKRNVVQAALRRVGNLPELPVADTLGMERPWRYRNQVQVPLHYKEQIATLKSGFFAVHSHRMVETSSCFLESAAMEATVAAVTRQLPDMLGGEVRGVHHLIVRESYTTGRQLVILCLRKPLTRPQQQAVRTLALLPSVAGVAFTVQPQPHGPMWGKSVEVLSGESFLTEVMDGLELLISARSFFQTNTQQARSLYRYVRQQAQILPGQRVFDAYCGTGSIGLYLALQGAQVLGVESNPAAVADAQRNAAHNGLQNTEFVAGSVERELPRRVAHGEKFDLIVLDPPREGCHREVLAALVAARSERIIYVSCNPATLARDLVELVRGGYVVEAVQPVDMFPQTAHVESVILMTRNKG